MLENKSQTFGFDDLAVDRQRRGDRHAEPLAGLFRAPDGDVLFHPLRNQRRRILLDRCLERELGFSATVRARIYADFDQLEPERRGMS